MRKALHMKVVFFAALAAVCVSGVAVAGPTNVGADKTGKITVPMMPADAILDSKYDEGQARPTPLRATAENPIPFSRPGRKDASTSMRLPTGETLDRIDFTFVTGDPVGTTPSDHCLRPAMSANGNFVAFTGLAQNLVADDTFGLPQIYRTELATGTNLLVSKNGPDAGNAGSGIPTLLRGGDFNIDVWTNSISDDGTKIVFTSEADNLAAAGTDTNFGPDVFLWNFNGGTPTMTMVSTTSAGTQMNVDQSGGTTGPRFSTNGIISGDGNSIVFTSTATLPGTTARAVNTADEASDLLAGQTISLDIFHKNLTTGTTTLVSHDGTNPAVEANSDSMRPVISQDGSRVAYQTRATNLGATAITATTAAGETGPRTNVYWWNAGTNANTNLSVTSAGAFPSNNLACFLPGISPNGRFVSWISRKNLQAPAQATNLYVRDLDGGASAIRVASANTAGTAQSLSYRRIASSQPDNSGNVYFTSAGDFNNAHTTFETFFMKKVYTNAWPATDAAGTAFVVSKTAGGQNPTAENSQYADGFYEDYSTRPSVSADGLKVCFPHNGTFNGAFATGGLLNFYVATLDGSTNVTGLERFPAAIATPGATVNFGGEVHERQSADLGFAEVHRPGLSQNGRYLTFPLNSLSVLEETGNPAFFSNSGGGFANMVRVDLQTGEFTVVGLNSDGTLLAGGGVSANESNVAEFGPTGQTQDFIPRFISTNCRAGAVANNGDVAFSSLTTPVGGNFLGFGGNIFIGNGGATEVIKSSLPGNPFWATGEAGAFINQQIFITPDSRYVGFTSGATNVHPDTVPGTVFGYIYDRATAETRLVTRRRRADGVGIDTPNDDLVLMAISNDGQKALYSSTLADDVIDGGPPTAGHVFLYNDLADAIPNNGDSFGATITLITTDGAGALLANNDTAALTLSMGFAATAFMDGNANTYVFEGIIDQSVATGAVAGVSGSQLYAKSLNGTTDSLGFLTSPLTILSKKNDGSFLTPLEVGGGLITNPDAFEEVSSAAISGDGGLIVFSSNARANGTIGFPGALGDANSPVNPPGGTSLYDVFVIENAFTTPAFTIASRGGSPSFDQALDGPETLVQLQTPTAFAQTVGVTGNNAVRVAFRFQGDDNLNPGDQLFSRDIYVKEFATPAPAAAQADWTSYQ